MADYIALSQTAHIKLLLGIDKADATYDDLIQLLIFNAKQYVEDYCGFNEDELDYDLEHLIDQMVVEDFNKVGNQGLESSSFSGVSENYRNGYSDHIMKRLKRHRRLRVL